MHDTRQIKAKQPNKSTAVSWKKYNFSGPWDLMEETLTGEECGILTTCLQVCSMGVYASPYGTTTGFPRAPKHMCSLLPAGGKHQAAINYGLWLARQILLQDLFPPSSDFPLRWDHTLVRPVEGRAHLPIFFLLPVPNTHILPSSHKNSHTLCHTGYCCFLLSRKRFKLLPMPLTRLALLILQGLAYMPPPPGSLPDPQD